MTIFFFWKHLINQNGLDFVKPSNSIFGVFELIHFWVFNTVKPTISKINGFTKLNCPEIVLGGERVMQGPYSVIISLWFKKKQVGKNINLSVWTIIYFKQNIPPSVLSELSCVRWFYQINLNNTVEFTNLIL